ncbi:MAG: YfhO family protein [Bryobacteraceae bacterium]|jgi:hypothetical protein
MRRRGKGPAEAAAGKAAVKGASPFSPRVRVVLLLAVAVLVFHWAPLTDPNTTPQWDTVDVHLSAQKYFSDEIREGRFPFWSNYAYSGYPFHADPQTGAWYPLNWPFSLAGITPKALQAEMALHSLLACLGAFFLASLWMEGLGCAAFVGVAYAFSGFFTGHSSHLGMFQTAAWLPWLLYGTHKAIRSGSLRHVATTGLAAGAMFLAGHFQTALYSFSAIALYALVVGIFVERRWRAALAVVAAVVAIAVLLSAVQWLPTMELVGRSTRASTVFTGGTNAPLEPRGLWTLIAPNHYGSVRGDYTGPADRTQFFFYGGLLLAPLAVFGLADKRMRWAALALVAPFAWYALGPGAGLYRLVASLPGFASVRAPVHAWFVIALGLALVAGSGLARVSARWKLRWLAITVAAFTFLDVFYWNSLENQLAYGRMSFEERYGASQEHFARAVRQALPLGTRFHSPVASPVFGPLNGAFDTRTEVTYGYNPLALQRYMEYFEASKRNPKLLDGLNAGLRVTEAGAAEAAPGVLPRFCLVRSVIWAADSAESLARLETLDPSVATVVEQTGVRGTLDAGGVVVVLDSEQGSYRLKYNSRTPGILRASIPWFPGWTAALEGKALPLRVADHALMGVEVPAGQHEITLQYHSTWFLRGALLSLATLLALGLVQYARTRPASRTISST